MMVEIMPDSSNLMIGDEAYLTLSQAMRCCEQASGTHDLSGGFSPIFNALVEGSLRAIQLTPAPAHDDCRMSGPVALDLDFWKRVWWPLLPNGNTKPSDQWLAWLLAGGIVVPLAGVRHIAASLADVSRNAFAKAHTDARRHHEGIVRTTFQLFWPITDVLAWIISRNEDEVRLVSARMHPLSAEAPANPWDTLDKIAERHCSEGQDRWRLLGGALMDLARRLHAGNLAAKEWPLKGTDLLPLTPDDFDRARFVHGTNSAGLLNGDFVGRAMHYVLLKPDDVRTLWPVDDNRAAVTSAGSDASPLAAFEPATPALVPMSDDEIEIWCREWLAGGHGNAKRHSGTDKAWIAFKDIPRARQLSRDDVFRPAFKRAKINI